MEMVVEMGRNGEHVVPVTVADSKKQKQAIASS